MNNTTTPTTTPTPSDDQAKHIKLYNAIRRLESVTDKLDSLIYKIQEPHSFKEDDTEIDQKASIPTFIEVLDTSPDIINNEIDKAHKLIEELENLLF